jgi:hypothetical protein
MKKLVMLAMLCLLLVGMVSLTGCKRYDEPEYETVETSETAFVVPLEGDGLKQQKFNSAEALEKLKISAKRIQVPHRWKKTGYMWTSGEWIGTVRVVKVDRQPITRTWTAESETGSRQSDDAIWAESKDSVGFSTGFVVSAMIKEVDAARFLYRYPTGSLANAMDYEVRGRTQMVFSDFAAGFNMSELRNQKVQIAVAVREDIIPFFADWGITITSVGLTGGFAYENKKVQEAIDNVFVAQREKEIALALFEAQEDKNNQIEKEANAIANKERTVAKGIADGKREILNVAKDAAQDPVFIELRRLEVEEARIKRWNGVYPNYYMTMGEAGGMGMLLNVPTAPTQQ